MPVAPVLARIVLSGKWDGSPLRKRLCYFNTVFIAKKKKKKKSYGVQTGNVFKFLTPGWECIEDSNNNNMRYLRWILVFFFFYDIQTQEASTTIALDNKLSKNGLSKR